MNNTTVISPVTENAPLVQEIPLDRIVESKTNPRRVFDRPQATRVSGQC